MLDCTSPPLTPDLIAGVVLSGGKSSRMGEDKALLKLKGRTLLDVAMDRVVPLCGENMIISSHPTHNSSLGSTFPDAFPGTGPLGGILTAFQCTDRPYILVTAVDMPILPQAFLKLVCRVPTEGNLARIPREKDQLQPLAGIYSRDCIPVLAQAHSQQQYGLIRALKGLPHEIVEVTAKDNFYFPEIFYNVNRPSDWEWMLKNG